jgi:hypothetical protein
MTHPLTDKIIEEELITEDECDYRLDFGRANYYVEDFRAGADWQLEQVIEWMKKFNRYDLESHSECDRMISDLRKAMRPQG